MTGLLHEREFSRKSFLKGSGAVVVGFAMLGTGLAPAKVRAAGYVDVPGPLDPTQVDSWLAVHPDGTLTLFSGKIELGQGTSTGFRQIVAEELDVPVESVHWTVQDTGGATPATNQGPTVGSGSIANGGKQVRAAAAYARQVLLKLASTQLAVPVDGRTVCGGVIAGG